MTQVQGDDGSSPDTSRRPPRTTLDPTCVRRVAHRPAPNSPRHIRHSLRLEARPPGDARGRCRNRQMAESSTREEEAQAMDGLL